MSSPRPMINKVVNNTANTKQISQRSSENQVKTIKISPELLKPQKRRDKKNKGQKLAKSENSETAPKEEPTTNPKKVEKKAPTDKTRKQKPLLSAEVLSAAAEESQSLKQRLLEKIKAQKQKEQEPSEGAYKHPEEQDLLGSPSTKHNTKHREEKSKISENQDQSLLEVDLLTLTANDEEGQADPSTNHKPKDAENETDDDKEQVDELKPLPHAEDVPYGCLKLGKKPTFRAWKATQTRKNTPITENTKEIPEVVATSRPSSPPPPLEPHRRKTSMKTTKIVRRQYTLGKSKRRRIVSILLKDPDTKKVLGNSKRQLQKESIKNVKQHLYRHGLVKIGTIIPIPILRETYEASQITGDIHNANTELFIQNFENETTVSDF